VTGEGLAGRSDDADTSVVRLILSFFHEINIFFCEIHLYRFSEVTELLHVTGSWFCSFGTMRLVFALLKHKDLRVIWFADILALCILK
jgi:hypothetical protein